MRDTFAAGRIANKREVLEHLRTCAEQARLNYEGTNSHYLETEWARAEQRAADYLEAHPELR